MNSSRFFLRSLHGKSFLPQPLYCVPASYGDFQQEVTSLVEKRLTESAEVNAEVKGRQMQLLSAMLADMSEPTEMLVTKLNCETKCELCV